MIYWIVEISYAFGESGSLLTYTYKPAERNDTRSDSLALRVNTGQVNADIVRVGSNNSKDKIDITIRVS